MTSDQRGPVVDRGRAPSTLVVGDRSDCHPVSIACWRAGTSSSRPWPRHLWFDFSCSRDASRCTADLRGLWDWSALKMIHSRARARRPTSSRRFSLITFHEAENNPTAWRRRFRGERHVAQLGEQRSSRLAGAGVVSYEAMASTWSCWVPCRSYRRRRRCGRLRIVETSSPQHGLRSAARYCRPDCAPMRLPPKIGDGASSAGWSVCRGSQQAAVTGNGSTATGRKIGDGATRRGRRGARRIDGLGDVNRAQIDAFGLVEAEPGMLAVQHEDRADRSVSTAIRVLASAARAPCRAEAHSQGADPLRKVRLCRSCRLSCGLPAHFVLREIDGVAGFCRFGCRKYSTHS